MVVDEDKTFIDPKNKNINTKNPSQKKEGKDRVQR